MAFVKSSCCMYVGIHTINDAPGYSKSNPNHDITTFLSYGYHKVFVLKQWLFFSLLFIVLLLSCKGGHMNPISSVNDSVMYLNL